MSLRAGIIATMCFAMASSAQDSGEFDHRDLFPLPEDVLEHLRSEVLGDPSQRTRAEMLIEAGREALVTRPMPLVEIHYEGLLNTNPKRIETVSSLRSMNEVADGFRAWQLTGETPYAEHARNHILAWAETYLPTGNDVNENKLTPMVVASIALRARFSDDEWARVEAWLDQMAEMHYAELQKADRFTNRFTKRLRFLALLGLALDRPELRKAAEEGVRVFVSHSLRADGTSFDLEERDTLTYHCSALDAALDTVMLASTDPRKLYAWENPDGGSLKKSVEYVLPFATGKQQRREWENSRIAFDRRRAEAGIATYQPGKLFDPAQALPMLRKAARIDDALIAIAYPDPASDVDSAYDKLILAALFASVNER